MTLFTRFLKDESGATAIEYALIAAIIGIGLLSVLEPVRTQIESTFGQINTSLTSANTP